MNHVEKTVTQFSGAAFYTEDTHAHKHMSYPQSVNTGLKVIGHGVCLEKSVVCDGAEGVVFATQLLLQLQCLLKAGLFRGRLSTGIEQCGVGGVCGS